ncbi:MAG: peptide-methionine (R)-S-oxide reductase [Bacteroidota bacterium]|jgi:peptide-methionine (R)-S-oxide reductase
MSLKRFCICILILSIRINGYSQTYMIQKTEKEWLQELGPERYHVLRQKGTEPPYSGTYNLHFQSGKYICAACKNPLFDHTQKFESHCGWPSFDSELGNGTNILKTTDRSHGMIRTEICCSKCGGHLGHVFDDGPTETGIRYCVNSLSLEFISNTPQSK